MAAKPTLLFSVDELRDKAQRLRQQKALKSTNEAPTTPSDNSSSSSSRASGGSYVGGRSSVRVPPKIPPPLPPVNQTTEQSSVRRPPKTPPPTPPQTSVLASVTDANDISVSPPSSINPLSRPTRNYSSSFSSFSYLPFAMSPTNSNHSTPSTTPTSSSSKLSQLLNRSNSISDSNRLQEKEKERDLDHFSLLPDELIVNILSRLSVFDLCRISQVSQRMNSLASDNCIWIPLYTKIWGSKGKGLRAASSSSMNNINENYKTRLCRQINEWKCPREAQINNRFTLDSFHDNTVNSVQFDKQKLVTAGRDGTIKIWKWKNGSDSIECVHTISDHNGPVLCCQYDKDKIISGSADRTIMVFDANTFIRLAVLEGHTESITCLQFDKTKIVSGSRDCTIKIWDIKTFKCVRTIKNPGPIACLKFTADFLVCSTESQSLRIWNFRDFIIPVHQQSLSAIISSTDNSMSVETHMSHSQSTPSSPTHTSPISSPRMVTTPPNFSPSSSPPTTWSFLSSIFATFQQSPMNGSSTSQSASNEFEKPTCQVKLPGISWAFEIVGNRLVAGCSDRILRIYEIADKELTCVREIALKGAVYSLKSDLRDKIVIGLKTGIAVYDLHLNQIRDLWNGGRSISAIDYTGQKLVFSQVEIDYEQERRPEVDLLVISWGKQIL
eukprot:TRINITY_DN90_c0_g2_i2.p1 TRINITY_DN90_c0_g2~~TRINITY_DN90_c0_g2_i2.p1  ORF type:complete len:667 (-),score=98.59 TRINITY_DN90_c0_g2_i2:981-2981(-)